MAKKSVNTFDDDFEIIVNDPLAEPKKVESKPLSKNKKPMQVESKVNQQSTEKSTRSNKKKSNYNFEVLRKTAVEMREGGVFTEKNSTVQIPVKFLALIKDIASATSRTSTEVATAMIKIMANEMKEDILKMIEEKEKKTKNILD